MQKAVIIIPTYNERHNIGPLLDALESVFKNITDYEMAILVYDSNSPDKTAEVVQSYQKKFSNIFLVIEEKKSGLGNAYIKAMHYAETVLSADIVFEFDADGSHRPEYLPMMMQEFSKGAEVVLGSRYVKGGSIPADWALNRKLLSVMGNRISQLVLSFKIKDYTTGFRGTRMTFLKKINLNNLRSKGYAYKIELLWRLFLLGAVIKEFPIHFVDRKEGDSKLPKNNMLESLRLIFYLRWETFRKFRRKPERC